MTSFASSFAPRWAASLIAFALLSCGNNTPPPADLVMVGGNFHTVSEANPQAEAIGIRDGEIVYVGDRDGVERFTGPETNVVDLGGRLVLPGFIDAHAHPFQTAGLSYALTLGTELTTQQVLDAVVSYAERWPDRPFILGFGFDETAYGPTGPRAEVLDAVVSDRPVILIDGGAHSAWVNTAALETFGIDADTPDPIPGRHYYQRDPDGTPTGWLVESQAFFPHLADLGAFDTVRASRLSNLVYALMPSVGLTTIYDAGMGSFEDDALEAAATLDRNGLLKFRVIASHMIQHPDQVPGAIDRFRELQQQYDGERLRIGFIKIHNDGTTEARTAAYLEPYDDVPGSSGAVLLEPEVLDPFVVAVDAAGIDLHIHAIGDRAVRQALDAIALARAANPGADTRHSLAHVEQVTDVDVPRFAELDVTAQMTPFWNTYDPASNITAVGDERVTRLFRTRDLLDAGARVSYGSDFPATGSELESMSPLWNIEAGATRQQIGNPTASILGGAAARVSVEDMVRGYTIEAAYQLHIEDEVGSLEVGKRADLVVLDSDIFTMPLHDIHGAQVEITMVDGQVVFGALP